MSAPFVENIHFQQPPLRQQWAPMLPIRLLNKGVRMFQMESNWMTPRCKIDAKVKQKTNRRKIGRTKSNVPPTSLENPATNFLHYSSEKINR